MAMRDLIPLRRRSDLARRPASDPIAEFRREFDRLFEDCFGDFGLNLPELAGAGWQAAWPKVNIAESEQDVVVTAELPGVDERHVSVQLDGDLLTLSGELDDAQPERGRRWTRTERTTGHFERSLKLPAPVLPDQSKATFKRGVLTITLAKDQAATTNRKAIPIQTG